MSRSGVRVPSPAPMSSDQGFLPGHSNKLMRTTLLQQLQTQTDGYSAAVFGSGKAISTDHQTDSSIDSIPSDALDEPREHDSVERRNEVPVSAPEQSAWPKTCRLH